MWAEDFELPPYHSRVAATEEEAERLDTKPGSPLLELTQIGFLDSGAAFEYSVSRNVATALSCTT